MDIIAVVPPWTSLNALSIFWSLAQELGRLKKGGSCFVPDDLGLTQTQSNAAAFPLTVLPSSRLTTASDFSYALVLDERREFLGEAQTVCLGLSPTVPDLARARHLRERLLSKGFPTSKIVTLLFNAGLPGGIPTELIIEEMGDLAAVFPYDPHLFVQLENQSTLIQNARPHSPVVLALQRVARILIDLLAEAPPGENRPLRKVVEQNTIQRLWDLMGQTGEGHGLSEPQIEKWIDRELRGALERDNDGSIDEAAVRVIRQNVQDHVMGLGPIEPLLRDDRISDIMINGDQQIMVERDHRLERVDAVFQNPSQLRVIIDRMVGPAGRRVDVASPWCDVRLSDGSRVNIILPPLSLQGPVVTIRRFRKSMLSFADLKAAGSITPRQIGLLERAVAERKNIFIAGNTGSGKTTLLNIMSGKIDPSERIITIEDSAELRLQQPHVVRLETRVKNIDGKGAVEMSDLVINALRMRPDRIIVGECRGAEAIAMLQALNTGHDGSMTTIHSNSAEDALKRLESMVLLGAPQWPVETVRQQMASAVDVIVYLKRTGTHRQLTEIVNVGYHDGLVLTPWDS